MSESVVKRTEREDFQATSDPAVMESADRGEVNLLSYSQLYELWERQQWATQDIDFTQDRIDWHERIPREEQFQRMYGLSSFFIGEQKVAEELGPMMRAAPTEEMRIFLCTQIADEARHVRFFNRFYDEVGILEANSLQGRLAETSEHVNPEFNELFDEMLKSRVDGLARRPEDLELLVEAVTLYHMVIEGMLALTGQHFILQYNEEVGTLPGFCDGFNKIARDEHRHVAFGARFLREMAQADTKYGGGHDPHAGRGGADRGRRAAAQVVRGRRDRGARRHDGGDARLCHEGTRAAAQGDRAGAGRLGLEHPPADGYVGRRTQEDHLAVFIGDAQREHLGHERPDLAWREVDHRHHQAPLQLLARVVLDLSGRALLAQLGPEVDEELPGGLARLGEVLDAGNAADAYVDLHEVVEVDHDDGRLVSAGAARRCVRARAAAAAAG